MHSSLFILVVLLSASVDRAFGYGEPYTSPAQAVGRPVYQERANFFLLNAARIDPSGYKRVYMAGHNPPVDTIMGSYYPAVAPVYLEPRLVAAAFNHSLDMAINSITPAKCFQHNTCITNEDTFVRIGKFYTCATGNGYKGENIAAGGSTAVAASNQWLCDKINSTHCAADGSSGDGHRRNIMSKNFASVGVGYASQSGSQYTHYWTQDFGTACTGETSPVYSGTHFVTGTTIKFAAIFYHASAVPSSAQVVVGGTAYSLAIELGANGKASYAYSTSTATSGCRSYHFTFIAGGATYRYPDTGCLSTTGESGCSASFDASCSGSTTNPTLAPTPAPTKAATPVPTTAATPAPTTAATPAPTTAATPAPTTAATPVPTTAATPAPTKAATPAPTKAATPAPTTAATPAPTRAPTSAPGGAHLVYQGGLQNNWSIWKNSATQVQHPFSYNGKTAVDATLGATSTSTSTSTYFYGFAHVAMPNTWSNVTFSIAARANCQIYFFINSGNNIAFPISVTTAWKTVSIPMSKIGTPTSIGAAQLTFYNPSSSATVRIYVADLYLNN